MKLTGQTAKKIQPNPSVVFTDLEDGNAVLLDLDSKLYYSLNGTGCFMWKIVEEGGAVDITGVAEKLVDEYEVEKDKALQDVEEFFGNLAKEGLISLS